MAHKSTILYTEFVTHDVVSLVVEKPEDFEFTPGQATEVKVDRDGWREKARPFTFTSNPDDPVIQFIIKIYPEHNGVTEQISMLASGDSLLMEDPWGTIEYKGKGTFIAGGAGITPFISIFRDLKKKNELKGNRLIFSNKEQKDIIIEKELRELFPESDLNLILTRDENLDENSNGYDSGRIDREYLEENIEDFSQNFYVCGPPEFNDEVINILKELGADPSELIFEE